MTKQLCPRQRRGLRSVGPPSRTGERRPSPGPGSIGPEPEEVWSTGRRRNHRSRDTRTNWSHKLEVKVLTRNTFCFVFVSFIFSVFFLRWKVLFVFLLRHVQVWLEKIGRHYYGFPFGGNSNCSNLIILEFHIKQLSRNLNFVLHKLRAIIQKSLFCNTSKTNCWNICFTSRTAICSQNFVRYILTNLFL